VKELPLKLHLETYINSKFMKIKIKILNLKKKKDIINKTIEIIINIIINKKN